MAMRWTCACCGRIFDQLLLDLAFQAPDAFHAVPEVERPHRTRLSSDFCRVDAQRFLRACLEVPVKGLAQVFVWGVWVEVEAEVWDRAQALFDADPPSDEPLYAGRLANELSDYSDTLGLAGRLKFRALPQRPILLFGAAVHELAHDQCHGLTLERVQEIVGPRLH